MLVRYSIVMSLCLSLSLYTMDTDIFFEKKKKAYDKKIIKTYFQKTLIDILPSDIQGHISNFIMQLSNVNFTGIDCYDDCFFKEKNPEYDKSIYYKDDEEVIEKVWLGLGDTCISHIYSQKNLKIAASTRNPGIVYISTISSDNQIFKKHYSHDIHYLIKNCFSPHGNVFAIRGKKLCLCAVNNGRVIYKTSKKPKHYYFKRVLFAVDESVIRIEGQNTSSQKDITYKLYFYNPIKDLLLKRVFAWRESLLLSKIYENNACYKKSEILKTSVDYYVYKGLSSEIRSFLKRYLNVVCR